MNDDLTDDQEFLVVTGLTDALIAVIKILRANRLVQKNLRLRQGAGKIGKAYRDFLNDMEAHLASEQRPHLRVVDKSEGEA